MMPRMFALMYYWFVFNPPYSTFTASFLATCSMRGSPEFNKAVKLIREYNAYNASNV
jgi:hypothetical protein